MGETDRAKLIGVLARRLPSAPNDERVRIADAYLAGAEAHAIERTCGSGSVPTGLRDERAELLAFVCRALGRLLSEEEIGALLRITGSAARAVQKIMLAVFDDLPLLIFKQAFAGAKRDGRGSQGDIENGFRVKFPKAQKMEMAQTELERRGLMCEVQEASATRHILLIESTFDLDSVLPQKS